MVGFHLYNWKNLVYLNQIFCVCSMCICMVRRSLFVRRSLGALSVFYFIACCFAWFNNIAYPNNQCYGPTGPKASQAQAFTFLVRDQCLGANIGSAHGPISLSKYLMHSSIGEVISGGETMHFWDQRAPWLEPLRGPNGLDLRRLKKDI